MRIEKNIWKAYILWDFLHDAINGIAYILLGSDKQRGQNQYDKCGFIMESEDIVVNADALELYKTLDVAKDIKHYGRSDSAMAYSSQARLSFVSLILWCI